MSMTEDTINFYLIFITSVIEHMYGFGFALFFFFLCVLSLFILAVLLEVEESSEEVVHPIWDGNSAERKSLILVDRGVCVRGSLKQGP